MDVVKRTGQIVALPVAGVWCIGSLGVGMGCIFVGGAGLTLYATGKYILTGKSTDFDSFVMKILTTTEKVAVQGFKLLDFCKSHTSQTVADLQTVVVAPPSKTVDELQAERNAQDQETSSVQAKEREDIIRNSK